MVQLWAVSLAVASLAIGMLGVLGVWLCYLFEAVGWRAPFLPASTPDMPESVDDVNNGLAEADLRNLGGSCQAEIEVSEEEVICPICLDGMEAGSAVRVLLGCNRVFHQDCVDRWFAISPRCPVCNVRATPKPPQTLTAAAKVALDC